ncbi:DUF3492 domain-containing protein [Streptomyces sp. N2-109]|uniref:D-inositol 3-phosphate glycosyltransferase n=1 Tax=Streptomyces gossypii TaxID=2883101 RepID=A0ABT2JXA8_9ACTN|nr:DUF3492 domain-containing protein [Streptomyces gossypii]MCT2591894.1 DUF3492 domain-containing protein [Streptomyces gossypii]
MRVALLTEGGYPSARGESVVWCDRLLRGLGNHEFEIYALTRSARQEESGWCDLPRNVARVCVAPLWGPASASESADGGGPDRPGFGRRERRRFEGHFRDLAETVCAADQEEGQRGAGSAASGGTHDGTAAAPRPTDAPPAAALTDRFASGLYGLAELARERSGLPAALRSEQAVRILEAACRAPGALRAAHSAQVADLLAVADRMERALRPLSLDWYGERGSGSGLAAADLCHAVGGGTAALAGLLAGRWYGTPLLLTEYGVRLREHYLASAADAVAPAAAGAPVRALLASFQRRLVRETYTRARLITPGNAHARRWQERCGARRDRLRTVYPGMDAAPFTEVGEKPPEPSGGGAGAGAGVRGHTLVWVGRIGPTKDLVTLLHAFTEIRRAVPDARLRIIAASPPPAGGGRSPEDTGDAGYTAHVRALAAQLFPPEPPGVRTLGTRTPGGSPVSFEEVGGPGLPSLADAYAAGGVVVLSSIVEGFPVPLVEAMFCARATVSTEAGAVREVIGGTGLVVPPRDSHALSDACLSLLRDPARRARLGAAARARALELFTAQQNIEAFRGIYLELMSYWQEGGRGGDGADGGGVPLPFARPPESHLPDQWPDQWPGTGDRGTGALAKGGAGAVPGWAGPAGWADDGSAPAMPVAASRQGEEDAG